MKLDLTKLKIAMARALIDPQQLATKAGIAYITLKRSTQTGRTRPSTVGKIAHALGVDIVELI